MNTSSQIRPRDGCVGKVTAMATAWGAPGTAAPSPRQRTDVQAPRKTRGMQRRRWGGQSGSPRPGTLPKGDNLPSLAWGAHRVCWDAADADRGPISTQNPSSGAAIRFRGPVPTLPPWRALSPETTSRAWPRPHALLPFLAISTASHGRSRVNARTRTEADSAPLSCRLRNARHPGSLGPASPCTPPAPPHANTHGPDLRHCHV